MSSSSFAPLVPVEPSAPAGFRALGELRANAERDASEAAGPQPSERALPAIEAPGAAGADELRGHLESIGASFVKSLQQVAAFRAQLRERYERELLDLALGVARKVVQQELAERPEIWLGMIRSAVRRAVDRERITVRLPPRLAAFLSQALPALRASLDGVKEFELIEDPALGESGCVIESRLGEIDIGVDTQIEAARVALERAEG